MKLDDVEFSVERTGNIIVARFPESCKGLLALTTEEYDGKPKTVDMSDKPSAPAIDIKSAQIDPHSAAWAHLRA